MPTCRSDLAGRVVGLQPTSTLACQTLSGPLPPHGENGHEPQRQAKHYMKHARKQGDASFYLNLVDEVNFLN